MEHPIFDGIGLLLAQVCIAAFIVFLAMAVDLTSGLYKAKLRGEVHSSWGLKRSVQKFILYEGAILIAGGIDVLVLTCRVTTLIGLDLLTGIAFFTGLIAILLCIVEILSLREKADEKTRKDINRAGELIESLVDKKQLADTVAEALADSLKHPDGSDSETAPDTATQK